MKADESVSKKTLTHPEWRATITERRTSSLGKDLRWRTNQQASAAGMNRLQDKRVAMKSWTYSFLNLNRDDDR